MRFLLCAHVIWATSAKAEAPTSSRFELRNSPGESVTSPVFPMFKDQWLRIDVKPEGPGMSIDIFVYRAVTKELAGRSSDDETLPYFQWSAAEAGNYYVVLRNTTPVAGNSVIQIMPEGSRGAIRGTLSEGASVQVLYATNRSRGTPENGRETYGAESSADGHMEYGVANVSIPRDHRMGELEGPSIFKLEFSEDKNKHVLLESAKSENKDAFFKDVKESQEKQFFVFVHGFNVSFEDAVRRTAQIKYDLGFDGGAILFSWPSQGKLSLVSYNKDGRNAEASASQLRQFLIDLSQATGVRTINLIAHSMGNRVAVRALAQSDLPPVHVRHVALMAPDIDAAEFVRLSKAMKSSADDVTLYASSGDAALKASEALAGYARAGEGGRNVVVIPGLIETIDASTVDTSTLGLLHSYYADNSTILSDLFHMIRGEAAKDRFGLQAMHDAKGDYWSFRPSVR